MEFTRLVALRGVSLHKAEVCGGAVYKVKTVYGETHFVSRRRVIRAFLNGLDGHNDLTVQDLFAILDAFGPTSY